MKTLRLLAFALLVLCLALLFASCGCSRSPSASADATTTTRPAVTDASTTASATEPPATTVPETTLSTEAEIISCGDFALDVKTLTLTVSNATASYSLADVIVVSDRATWVVRTTTQDHTVFEDKVVPLEPGDNTFSLYVSSESRTNGTAYTVVIHRRPLWTLTFDANGGTPVDSQKVEEGDRAIEPTTSRIGYSFAGWDHDFSEPIMDNLTVTASWTPKTDTPYVVEYYLENVTGTDFDKILTDPKAGTTDSPVSAEQKTYAHFTFSPSDSTPSGNVAPDGSLVLKMYYLRDVYTVTFNGNGGTLTEGKATQSVRYGAAAATPAFARSGYDFAGWDSVAGCDAVEQPLSITAQWTVIDYAITYTLNGGTNNENNPATYTVEDEIELADPTRNGYTFADWSNGGAIEKGSTGAKTFVASWTPINYAITYTLNGGTNNENNPATYTIEDEVALAAPTRLGYTFNSWSDDGTIELGSTGEKTFVASWTVIDYAITYTLNGGTNNENNPAAYTVEDEIELADPTRNGYTFAGWSNGGAIEKGSTGAKTFVASWTPINYAINYTLNGGTNNQNNPATYTIEDEVALADPTRLGYTFNGWSDDGTIAQGSTGEKTFVASWTVIDYAITYTMNGGTNDENNPATYTVEDAIELAAPTRNGYTFAGWSNGGAIEKGSTGAKTFVASWTPINYAINYTLNGGTNNQNNPATYTIEDEVALADPTRLGYTFNGWSDDGVIERGSTGAKTFVATWTVIDYAITYTLNGGTNNENNPATYTVEDAIELAAPTRNGYSFAGWSNDGVIAKGSSGAKTFVANWTAINYAITYNLNDGTNNENNPATYTIEDEIALAAPTRLGYTFNGWSDDGTIAQGSTGEKTFVATWTIIHYPITYHLGGAVNDENNPATYTVEDEVALADLSRVGYTFNGWSNGGVIAAGSTGEKTFTANWTAINYAITYNLNGGTNSANNPATYTIEDEVELADPTRLGYTFTGWTDDGTIARGSTGAKSFTASWTINTYTVSYNLNGGSLVGSNPTTYTIVDNAPLISPTRNCYRFLGWYTANGTRISNLQGNAANLSLTARWECYVTLDGSGAITGVTDYCRQNVSTLNVPSNLGGTTVRSVTSDAFNDYTRLTSITLPNTVTSIGQGAFRGCSGLVSMTIPFVGGTAGKTSSDTYQYPFGYIFGTTSYTGGTKTQQYYYGSSTSSTTSTNYYIPASLRSVTITGGNVLRGAFYNCSALTSINLPNSATGIGSYAFYKCSGLTSVSLPEGITNIGNYAFYQSGPAPIVIPNSVTSIGDHAFYQSGVTSLTIGRNVATIGEEAFESCSGLTSIIWNAVNCTVAGPGSFTDCVFTGCSNVASITIGNNVETIPAYAFRGCTGLSSVTIGYAVTSIGNYAFGSCSGSYSLVIPNSVTSIGDHAFYQSGVTSLTIGRNVATIGEEAFESCSGLTSIIWNAVNCTVAGPGSFTDCVFTGCSNVASITVGNNVETIPAYAFRGCTGEGELVIPSSVTSIGAYAFYGCDGFTSVSIGNNVSTIGSYAFAYCDVLYSITIPANVTAIEQYTFKGCTGLTTVYFARTTGWYRSGTELNLSDAYDNASSLRSTSYRWYRQ